MECSKRNAGIVWLHAFDKERANPSSKSDSASFAAKERGSKATRNIADLLEFFDLRTTNSKDVAKVQACFHKLKKLYMRF
jgi:phosphopantetheinyl transferase (holo-ACP synthase)